MFAMKLTELTKETLRETKHDPSKFSSMFLNFDLYWFQKEMLSAIVKGHDVAICCSRQIGKTESMAIAVVWWAVTRPKNNILIVSATLEQALEFYTRVLTHFKNSPIINNLMVKETMRETILMNGSRIFIRAVGQKGIAIRGRTIHLLVMDEADFIPDKVYTAIEATQASTDGQMILISTPHKKGTTFYGYFQDGMSARKEYEEGLRDEPFRTLDEDGTEFVSFHYDYLVGYDVFKPTGQPQLSRRKIRRAKKTKPKWEFEQEFLAIWAEDIASYFSSQLIIESTEEYDLANRGIEGVTYFMGVDFAKRRDKTVAIVIAKETEYTYRIAHIFEDEGRSYHEQRQTIEQVARNFNVQRAWMDKTGVGEPVIDEMNDNPESFLYGKIEYCNLTIQSKVDMYGNLHKLFSMKMLKIPSHKKLLDELMYLQFEKAEVSQYIRIHAPEGGHDDYPDALAMACMFATELTIDDLAKAILQVASIHRKQEREMVKDARDKYDYSDTGHGTERKMDTQISKPRRDMVRRRMKIRKYF